jgi:hypothetical protein
MLATQRGALRLLPALVLLAFVARLSMASGADLPPRLHIHIVTDTSINSAMWAEDAASGPAGGVDAVPRPGNRLFPYLRGRGDRVNELRRDGKDLGAELKDVALILRTGDSQVHKSAEVKAYTSFVENGGSLVLAAGFFPARTPGLDPSSVLATLPNDPLEEAFGVHFQDLVRRPLTIGWADHPLARGLSPLRIEGTFATRLPSAATVLAVVSDADRRTSGSPVIGVMSRGKGRVLIIGSIQPLLEMSQPLTDRLLNWLTPASPGGELSPSPAVTSAPGRPSTSAPLPPSSLPSTSTSTSPSPEEIAAYRTAAERAGGGADEQVRLALWSEALGLEAERLKHLTRALEADPANATARGLLGQVAENGKWSGIEAIEERTTTDPDLVAALVEYRARRLETPQKADDQWKLALWCAENGLEAEARAHLTVVTRLSPGRAEAWSRLGCKQYEGRWLTEPQIAAAKAEAQAQKDADRSWQFRLETLARHLFGPEAEHARWAEEAAQVTDPRAVPSVWRVFIKGNPNPRYQETAAQLLSQIDSPLSTQRLAVLALFGRSEPARRSASETLLRRDPRDFLEILVSVLQAPLNYELRRGATPNDPAELLVEGERFNLLRFYGVGPGGGSGDGTTGFAPARARTDRGPAPAGRTPDPIAGDVSEINAHNQRVRAANEPVLAILREATGQDLGADKESWMAWWTDQQGYAYTPKQSTPKPTLLSYVQVPLPQPPSSLNRTSHSCFGAGTPVHTASGLRPIEELSVGDSVLTQDAKTGALSFQPIVAVFHNRPAPTFRVQIGQETIMATGIHRFWVAGKGWVMARDLKRGTPIRMLEGRDRIVAVDSGVVQPVFNLELAEGKSFFVGDRGVLVHDNTLVDPVLFAFDSETVAVPTAAAR